MRIAFHLLMLRATEMTTGPSDNIAIGLGRPDYLPFIMSTTTVCISYEHRDPQMRGSCFHVTIIKLRCQQLANFRQGFIFVGPEHWPLILDVAEG